MSKGNFAITSIGTQEAASFSITRTNMNRKRESESPSIKFAVASRSAFFLALFGCLLVSFPRAAVAGPKSSTPVVNVLMKDFSFVPKRLVIKKGTKVHWVDVQSGVTHDIDSDDDVTFSSPDMTKGKTFNHTFKTVGTFPYHCNFHGAKGGLGMAGTIIVRKK